MRKQLLAVAMMAALATGMTTVSATASGHGGLRGSHGAMRGGALAPHGWHGGRRGRHFAGGYRYGGGRGDGPSHGGYDDGPSPLALGFGSGPTGNDYCSRYPHDKRYCGMTFMIGL